MRRRWLSGLLPWSLCLMGMLWPAFGVAQVEQGHFVFSVNTVLLDYQRAESRYENLSEPQTTVEREIGFGPTGGRLSGGIPGYVAFGAGYVVHRHVVPSLQFAVEARRHRYDFSQGAVQDSTDESPERAFMLRPACEFPITPDSRVVLSALGGLDFRRYHAKPWLRDNGPELPIQSETKTRALGPLLGLVGHFFVLRGGSIDLSAVFAYDFLKSETSVGTQHAPPKSYERMVTLSLLVGVSLWP
ncbi:MAG: hypothetical protein QM778_21015 [Myxococcales bacterium]